MACTETVMVEIGESWETAEECEEGRCVLMKIHSEYPFKGIPGTYPPDPDGVITILYEFDTEAEMNASGLLCDSRRTTCFMSNSKYFVGGHFEQHEKEGAS